MKCKCLNCSKIYNDKGKSEVGELLEIACPCCGSYRPKIKPYVEEVNEQNQNIPSRKIIHG